MMLLLLVRARRKLARVSSSLQIQTLVYYAGLLASISG